jgi:hypothetical protein
VFSVVHALKAFTTESTGVHREMPQSKPGVVQLRNFGIAVFKKIEDAVRSHGDFGGGGEQRFCVLMLRILRDLIG